jgi:hypothetical protein
MQDDELGARLEDLIFLWCGWVLSRLTE